jgi:hypothetical protein
LIDGNWISDGAKDEDQSTFDHAIVMSSRVEDGDGVAGSRGSAGRTLPSGSAADC